MSDKVSQVMSTLASEAESESTPVTPKGHGGQPKAPLVSFHTEGPRSPSTSKKGISSPFSYASAVANRSKAPVTGSVECEQYRALAAKARESPRILSIKLQKPPASNQEPEKPLSQADWGELLFNSCGISPGDIRGVDFQAGGPLNCEVKLTDSADIAKYVGISGSFNNYSYNTSGPAQSEVLITFKGVPLEVPDVEIIWLLKSYGYKPSSEGVLHSPVPVTSLDKEVSCKALESNTRSIRATPPTARRLRGYYFWAGLQEADKPRRVSVEHKGRGPRQCPHCLKTAFETFPCSFNAKGSACKRHGAKRTSLAQYNKVLREQDGYQTLRQLMLSSPAHDDQELEQESDLPPTQLELEEEEEWDGTSRTPEVVAPLLLQVGNWAEEPSSLVPQPAKESLELQVASLTKQLSEVKDAATKEAHRARQKLSQVELESKESKRALSLTRRGCVTEIRDLITVDESQTWTSNTERLIAQLSNTTKLSEFTLNPEGKLVVKEGCDPFADLQRDIQALPSHLKARARARADVIITGVMNKAKTRVLQQESNKPRSASRSREPDSEEEQSSSKAQKPSPRSPPHQVVGEEEGEGNEGWPALPSPGAKGGLQVPTQALGSQKDTSPLKDSTGPKGPVAQLQPPMGANSPPKDSTGPKAPETQLQLISSQEAPKTEGPKSGLQKPGVSAKGPFAPWRAPRHSEEESASKGTPQKGPKERPQEAGNSGAPNRATKETSKPLGPHLKAPLSRPPGSSGKGDSKVTNKAKQ